MHTRVMGAVLLLAALTACASSSEPKPAATVAVTASSSPTKPTKAQAIQDCADAIQAGRDKGAGAPECTDLPLDDYYDALRKANEAGREAQ
jgi:hypothetical protein